MAEVNGTPEADARGLPLVPYVPIVCPRCRTPKPNTYGRGDERYRLGCDVRYHSCRHCGWRFQSLEFDLTALLERPEIVRDTPQVLFVAFRCPSCNEDKPRTTDQRGRVRWHRCQECGRKFRSLQLTRAELTPQLLRDLRIITPP